MPSLFIKLVKLSQFTVNLNKMKAERLFYLNTALFVPDFSKSFPYLYGV